MLKTLMTSGAVLMLSLVGAARADVIPYPSSGSINPQHYVFTATSTGDLSAYFYGSTAAFEESFGLLLNGKNSGIFGLDNKSTPNGTKLDFGIVTKGTRITPFIDVKDFFVNGQFRYYSNVAFNSDATNHVYASSFSGDPVIRTSGTYVGFEDLSPAREKPDYNYTDTQFVLSNTTATVVSGVPEPATWAMMLLGFGSLGFLAYRKSLKSKAGPAMVAA